MIVGPAEKKMGQTGSATNAITFEDCRIPAAAVLGTVNDGFRIAVGELAGGRIGIASAALGIARAAMDQAIAYVKEREQFGRKVADMIELVAASVASTTASSSRPAVGRWVSFRSLACRPAISAFIASI